MSLLRLWSGLYLRKEQHFSINKYEYTWKLRCITDKVNSYTSLDSTIIASSTMVTLIQVKQYAHRVSLRIWLSSAFDHNHHFVDPILFILYIIRSHSASFTHTLHLVLNGIWTQSTFCMTMHLAFVNTLYICYHSAFGRILHLLKTFNLTKLCMSLHSTFVTALHLVIFCV